MKPTKMAALVLAGMALVGMTYSVAGQKALAHSFSEDESATFLVNIWAAKVHLMLVGKNLANSDAAVAHIDHVHMIIDDEMLNEIAERNERIAEDIPAALDELAVMIEEGDDRSAIVGQFREISNLLAEAVSVRIDREHIAEPKVQALIVAGLLDNALASYEQAFGLASSEHNHDATEDSDHMMEGDMEHNQLVNHDSYVAAKAFATLAKNTFLREKLVNSGAEEAHEAQEGLVNLKNAIYAKHSVEDVTVAVHIGVHEKLQHAFSLELAEGHDEDEEHEGEHEEDDHMDEGSMEESDHMEG
jgi:hypothetical protein